jgi:hypothetical protein
MKPYTYYFATLFFALFSTISPANACTKDEAFNKMMAIGRAQQSMMSAAGGDNAKMLYVAEMAKEVGDVGKVLADGKYAEACGYYDKIARKYKVDLKESAKGMVTMAEIRKDGGKQGGSCSQADASVKMMNLSQKMEDKAALGDITRGQLGEFLKEIGTHNDLMYSNPSGFCSELDKIAAKYSVSE